MTKRAHKRTKPRRPAIGVVPPDAAAKTASVVRILNCSPSKNTETDWQIKNAENAGILRAAAPIPDAKDLRESWWSINDQGSTGSCVGWAAADSVIRWHLVKAQRLAASDLLSPRFTWMAAKEVDEFDDRPSTFIETEGTSLKAALDIARKYGCVRDAVLPFASGALYLDEADTFYAIASNLKIASYINLGRDLKQWRKWLANKGPILTRLNCDDTWMHAKETSGKLDLYDRASATGGHAVALVGYDPNMFVVRNSWGTTLWGEKGFGFASNMYASEAFTEAYGVSVT